MPDKSMGGTSWLIVELGGALVFLAVLCFFVNPIYEKGAYYIIGLLGTAFGVVVGYQFGRKMPEQASDPKAGQSTQVETVTKVSAASPVVTDPPKDQEQK